MTDRRWQQARALFEEALELEDSRRADFVAERCGDDRDLLCEVRSLLSADSSESTIGVALDEGAAMPAPTGDEFLGARVGSFAVQRLLGSGGMGAVYAAQQDEPRRSVALKVMSLGLRSASAVRRFRWEAEVLARLRHPGIAQVYEVGVHRAGGLELPWFAMELVDGARDLVRHADEEALAVSQRVELLLQVCAAVHHGHLQGIVHRDLKPQNILVDREGRVKVIDFGIARCSEGDQEAGVRTATGFVLGTLHYMSPEQLMGDDVDLRTDVHALGVVAFELLAGRLPHDLAGLQPLTAAQRLLEREPMRLRAVRPRVDPDLEVVVGKAMMRDRELRYESVAALAADLRAVLAGLPVQARPPSTFYQVRMFARRHRGLVLGLAGLVFVLAAGLAVVAVKNAEISAQNVRIERERNRAQRVSSFARGILAESDMMRARGVDYTVREALDVAATEVDAEPWDDPETEVEIRELLGSTYSGLSLPAQAEPHLLRALELRRKAWGADSPEAIRAELRVAMLRRDQDRTEEAQQMVESLRPRATAVLGARDPLTLSVVHDMAVLWRDAGRLPEAEATYREVLALREDVLGPDHAETLATMHTLGTLLLADGRPAEAREVLAQCLERRSRRGGSADHPVTFMVSDNLAEALRDLGELDEAERLHRQAMAGFERLLGPDHENTLGACYHLLKVLHARGDAPALQATAEDLLQRCTRVFGADHRRTMDVRNALGSALLAQDDAAGAVREFRFSRDVLLDKLGADHPSVFTSAQNLVFALVAGEDFDGALAVTGPLVERVTAGTARLNDREIGLTLMLHGRVLRHLGRTADAEPHLRAARQRFGEALPKGHPLRLQTAAELAAVCTELGHAAEAALFRSEAEDAPGR